MNKAELPNDSLASKFAESLFQRDGIYVFDPDEATKRLQTIMSEQRDWYQRKSNWAPDRIQAALQALHQHYDFQFHWEKAFSGFIPRSWTTHFYHIKSDFQKAQELSLQLSDTLIAAGITYPHNSVIIIVGTSQRLTLPHLTALFVHPLTADGVVPDIIKAQRNMQVDPSIIELASINAQTILHRYSSCPGTISYDRFLQVDFPSHNL